MPTLDLSGKTFEEKTAVWTAYCSNVERPVADCVALTENIIADDTREGNPSAASLASALRTVNYNRKSDEALLSALFAVDNKDVAIISLVCIMEKGMSGNEYTSDVPAMLAAYKERYGITDAYRVAALRWYVFRENYEDNKEAVELLLNDYMANDYRASGE